MNIVRLILRLFSVLVSSTVIGAIPVYYELYQCVIDHVMIYFVSMKTVQEKSTSMCCTEY